MTFRSLKSTKLVANISNIRPRYCRISKSHVGQAYRVWTGRAYALCIIKFDMVGFRFGDFSMTRKMGAVHNLSKKANIIGGIKRSTRPAVAAKPPVFYEL